MTHKSFICATLLALFCAAGCVATKEQPVARGHEGVQITQGEGKLRIEINGELFTEYYYQGVPRPYLYPVIGPHGLPVTRNWPMNTDVENEEHDHPHHRSLWWAHGDINGIDFWSETASTGKTVHDRFLEMEGGPKYGIIHSLNNLVAPDGKIVGTEEQLIRIYNVQGARILDFEVSVIASHGDVVLGDTKEGSMAMRLAETMRLKGKVGQGHIINSAGDTDGNTWGKRSAWCDYNGPVNGQVVGVAIMDHPTNPRHPTWWHVRDYGLFAANPFGVHDFEKKEPQTGAMAIPEGQRLKFRYRFFIHSGNDVEANVQDRYLEYIGALKQKP